MIKFSFLLITFCCFSLSAQNVSKEDMKLVLSKMNDAYTKSKSYSMNIQHASYVGHSSNTPIEQYFGSFAKSGENYYSNLLNVETIQNSTTKVSVSKAQKVVIVSNGEKLSQKVMDKDYLDHVLEQTSKIELSSHGDQKTYTLYMKNNGEFESYSLTINSNYFMSELVMNYRLERSWEDQNGKKLSGKPKLVVSYSNIKINTAIDQTQFKFDKYLIKSGDSYKLASAFRTYTLNDNRIK